MIYIEIFIYGYLQSKIIQREFFFLVGCLQKELILISSMAPQQVCNLLIVIIVP